MDWSGKNLCIKCNKGRNLLVCSENGCPLAIHEGCLGCPARFDDAGRFFCPYCLYKKAVADSRQAREYALARKEALLIFMDEEMIGSEKPLGETNRAEGNGQNLPKVSAENANVTTSDDGKNDGILDRAIHVDKEHKNGDAEEKKSQEEESETSAGSEGQEPSIQMPEEQKTSKAEEKEIQEGEHETSAASSSEDTSVKMHEENICNAEEEKIQDEKCETSSASTSQDPSLTLHARAKRRFERGETVQSKLDKQSEKNKQTSPTVNPVRRSSRRSSSALRTKKTLNKKVDASRRLKQSPQPSVNKKVGASRRLKQSPQPSVKLANDLFGNGKRKRLLWREDEEEMLKVGVQKYSGGNKNHPWRKILEFGHKVFDATRTPGDLKDKWRNMSAR